MSDKTIQRLIAEAFIKAELDFEENKYYTDGEIIVWKSNSQEIDDRFFPIYYCFDDRNSYELNIDWPDRIIESTEFDPYELIQDYVNTNEKESIRDENGDIKEWVWGQQKDAINWALTERTEYTSALQEIEQEERERLIDFAEETCDLEGALKIKDDDRLLDNDL